MGLDYGKVRLLLQAPPGRGLGMTLANENGMVSPSKAYPADIEVNRTPLVQDNVVIDIVSDSLVLFVYVK